MTVFKADGTGRVALYSGTDDAPFTNPRANLSRIHFHTDFDYLAFPSASATLTGSITIPVTVSSRTRTINIGAHGRSGVPFVFGQVSFGGDWIPLVGSVPVHIGAGEIGGLWAGHLINWTLAVSSSNVFIVETRTTPTFSASLPAARSYRVWVSNNIMA